MTMKKIALIIFLSLTIGSAFSQEIKITEPEFIGNILFVNDTIGVGVKLEQQVCSLSSKSNAASYVPFVGLAAGKSKTMSVVNGSSSPVKIEKKEKIQFIVKVANNSVDPSTIINIFKLTSEKDKRTLELASAKVIGGSKAGDIQFIPFQGKKYGESSYLIEISSLEQGEYAMTLAERRDLFHMFCIQ